MRVLLVSPPRPIWPYIDEQDNFLVPQWMVCLGAVLREAGVEVLLTDCMAEQLGWASLEARIRQLKPDLVASGENHALFASSVVRLVALAKEIDPGIVTVVGGAHFTNTYEHYLARHPIDVIVRGEGEATLLELVAALERAEFPGARSIAGIAYRDGEEIVCTAPRELVPDLDDLPLPAYDLLPMARYGRARYLFSPGGATIHHSRGCVGRCRFCAWWRQMATREATCDGPCRTERLTPRWRTKSVERTLAEVEVLYRRYGKRCLVFVDPTFNVDPAWNEAFADALIRKSWDLVWFAFLRADFLLRDERRGIFEKMVRSGLTHVCIGVERTADEELQAWSKPHASSAGHLEAFRILKTKYPQVVRQATFIVGARTETPESLESLFRFARRIDADYPAFHPVTPFPGTDLYDEARAEGWLEIEDFDQFDLMTPVMSAERMSRQEIEAALVDLNRRYVSARWYLKGLLSRSRYRRNLYIWFLLVSGRLFLDSVAQRMNPLKPERYTSAIEPRWYET